MYMDQYIDNKDRENRNKKGFTLIELIVVILILGVIAAVAVPKITVAMDEAKGAKLTEDLKAIRIATLTAAAENPLLGTLPTATSPSKKAATYTIAEVLGLEAKQHTSSQDYYIPSIEIPESPKWYFKVNNIETPAGKEFRLILHIESLDKESGIGDRIATGMGMGKPTNNKNDLVYWSGSSVVKDHLNIVIHTYPPL